MVIPSVILLVVAGLIFLLCSAKVTVCFRLKLDGWRPELSMEAVFFRLLRKQIQWSYPQNASPATASTPPMVERDENLNGKRDALPWNIHDGRALLQIVRRFLQHVSVQRWETVAVLGTGQSHVTGMLAGWLWALQGFAQAVLFRSMRWQTTPRISIQPNFQRPCFVWHLHCITSFRLGHAIIAGVRLFVYWFWRRKRLLER